MGEYLTPGVYVEEISNGARPIQAVGTRTAGFVGVAPDPSKNPLQAVLVTNWSEFKGKFAPPPAPGSQTGKPVSGSQGNLDLLNKASEDAQKLALVQNESVAVYEAWKTLQDAKAELARTGGPGLQDKVDRAEKDLVSKLQAQQTRIQTDAITQAQGLALQDWSGKASKLAELTKRLATVSDPPLAEADKQTIKGQIETLTVEVDAAEQNVLDLFETKLTDIEKQLDNQLKDAKQNVPQPAPGTGPYLADAVYGFFLNGGSRCYIVNLGATGTVSQGLAELEKIDEIAIVAAPGYDDMDAYTAVRDHCDTLKDRVGILDCPRTVDDQVLDLLGGVDPPVGAAWQMPPNSQYGDLTLYAPWLVVTDPNAPRRNGNPPATKLVPPSGHVAGIWARNDVERGVYKAPANEPVRGAIDLERRITHSQQGVLNSRGVNVIRFFPNAGILVWGARTLHNNDEFKYLNIRRFFNMIEESIQESTRWIVFEPNDRPLWQAIRRDVTSFLMGY